MPNPFSYQLILAAKAGDPDSISTILQHYSPYIASLSKRPFYDEFGKKVEFVDEEIRQQIEIRLITQIIYKFDPHKIPNNETLEIN